jgi:dynein heavy chain
VSVEEAEASEQAAEVKGIKDGADAELAIALPALDIAVKKVREIDVKDFYELRTIGKPSPSIVKMFEVVSYMLKLSKPKKNTDEKSKETDPDGFFI